VVLGGSPDGPRRSAGAFGRKSTAKIVSSTVQIKIHTTYISLLKLPLLIDLAQKVCELVLPITSCPFVIILENILNYCIKKYGYGNFNYR
jgi:hypothetical protein